MTGTKGGCGDGWLKDSLRTMKFCISLNELIEY